MFLKFPRIGEETIKYMKVCIICTASLWPLIQFARLPLTLSEWLFVLGFEYFVSKCDELLTSLTSINTGTINNSLITLHLDGLTNSILLNGNENRILSK